MKHVYEKVFTSDSGMRRNVPKVLVVVTDGRSQDDVKKSAEKLQHSGMRGIINHRDFCKAHTVLETVELFGIIRFLPNSDYFTRAKSFFSHLLNIPYSDETVLNYLLLNNGLFLCVFSPL